MSASGLSAINRVGWVLRKLTLNLQRFYISSLSALLIYLSTTFWFPGDRVFFLPSIPNIHQGIFVHICLAAYFFFIGYRLFLESRGVKNIYADLLGILMFSIVDFQLWSTAWSGSTAFFLFISLTLAIFAAPFFDEENSDNQIWSFCYIVI